MQKLINRGHIAARGFTLIELLVVIAIIGILAGIVLASLGSARSKGGDAAVQGDLVGIRSQAEIYASSNGNSYGSVATSSCAAGASGTMFNDPNVKSAMNGAASAGGGTVKCGAWTTGTGGWVVAAQLKSSGNYWCVSSSGSSTMISSAGLTSAAGDSCY